MTEVTQKKKPFQTDKPRSEWRKPVRKVYGRIVKAVSVGVDEKGEAALKRIIFELRPNDGLVVRRCGARKTTEKTWTFQHLSNIARTQMSLFPEDNRI